MPAFEIGTFERPLTVAAGGEREERWLRPASVLFMFCGIFRADGAAVAGVGQQDFPLGVDLAAQGCAQFIHGVAGSRRMGQIEVGGRQISLPAENGAVPGEVNHDAVVVLRHRRQPDVDRLANGGQTRLGAGKHLDVFRFEITAFGADKRGVDGLRIALREVELPFGGQLGIRGNPHDHGVTVGRCVRRRLRRLDLFEFEIALSAGWRRLSGGQSRESESG